MSLNFAYLCLFEICKAKMLKDENKDKKDELWVVFSSAKSNKYR